MFFKNIWHVLYISPKVLALSLAFCSEGPSQEVFLAHRVEFCLLQESDNRLRKCFKGGCF